MIIEQSYEKTIKKVKGEKPLFIDVRSPCEYEEAHIPGAINIPLFSNEERKHIGTLYKQQGKKEAVREGIRIVGPKVGAMYSEFEKNMEKGRETIVYCARGGMRSSSVVSLFKEFSLPVIKLKEGYKGYRRFLNENLPLLLNEKEFIALYGKTGSGKTKILKKISEKGFDVLDLEGCANHRGSLLGGIGLGKCSTQKNFEAYVLESIIFSKTPIIYTEGESKRIGSVVMPGYLFEKVINARKMFIDTDILKRVEIIKEEYLKENYSKDEINSTVEKLGRYVGEKKVREYIEELNCNNYDSVIKDMIENYYDKVYKTKSHTFEKIFHNRDEEECALEIIGYIQSELEK